MFLGLSVLLYLIISVIWTTVAHVSMRIFSSDVAQYGQFPSTIAVLREDKTFICTGSLITREHVISAGHCYVEDPDSTYYCLGGDVRYSRTESIKVAKTKQIIEVASISIHLNAIESFKKSGSADITNDFAILKMSKAFALNNNLKIIKIAISDLKNGDRCSSVGFKITNEIAGTVELRWGAFQMDRSKCPGRIDSPKEFCVYCPSGNNCTIPGESGGGPLLSAHSPYIYYGTYFGFDFNATDRVVYANAVANRIWISAQISQARSMRRMNRESGAGVSRDKSVVFATLVIPMVSTAAQKCKIFQISTLN